MNALEMILTFGFIPCGLHFLDIFETLGILFL